MSVRHCFPDITESHQFIGICWEQRKQLISGYGLLQWKTSWYSQLWEEADGTRSIKSFALVRMW